MLPGWVKGQRKHSYVPYCIFTQPASCDITYCMVCVNMQTIYVSYMVSVQSIPPTNTSNEHRLSKNFVLVFTVSVTTQRAVRSCRVRPCCCLAAPLRMLYRHHRLRLLWHTCMRAPSPSPQQHMHASAITSGTHACERHRHCLSDMHASPGCRGTRHPPWTD